MKADEVQLLSEIGVGDIGALVGCKNVRSGDTITEDLESEERIVLDGVPMPPPVFFCTIEAESSRD